MLSPITSEVSVTRRDDISLRRDAGEFRVHDNAGAELCAINDVTAILLETCQSPTTLRQLADTLLSMFADARLHEVDEMVPQAVERLALCNVVHVAADDDPAHAPLGEAEIDAEIRYRLGRYADTPYRADDNADCLLALGEDGFRPLRGRRSHAHRLATGAAARASLPSGMQVAVVDGIASGDGQFAERRTAGHDGAVLWPVQMDNRRLRHRLHRVALCERPWPAKTAAAMWRGRVDLSGRANDLHNLLEVLLNPPADAAADQPLSPGPLLTRCSSQRGIDVGIDTVGNLAPASAALVRESGIYQPPLPLQTGLGYRYWLLLEDRDFLPRLVMALASDSVVVMPSPRTEHRFGRELAAWRHYVPVAADFSDLAQVLDWCRDNEGECRDIAARATRMVTALVDRRVDDAIGRGMLARLAEHAGPAPR